MKEPKKAKKALEYFEELIEWIEFYAPQLPREEKNKLIYIADTISELSIEEKVKNIRLATKLKAKWREQEKELVEKAERYDKITEAVAKASDGSSTD